MINTLQWVLALYEEILFLLKLFDMKKVLYFLLFSLLAIPSFAQSAEEYYNKGMTAVDNKNYTDALAEFKYAIAKKSDYTDALYEAGWCCNELEKYADAIPYLQLAVKSDQSQAKIYYELAYSYESDNNTDEAITNYKKAVELYNEYYDAYRDLGNIYYTKEDYEKAFDNYTKYLEDKEADNNYNYKAAWCLNDMKKYEEAIGYLEKYEPEETDDIAKKYAELGYANYKLKNNDAAVQAYEKALAEKPGYGTALRGLGNVYYDNTEEYDKAIENFEAAIKYDEENSKNCYYKLGWLYNDAEKYEEAIHILQKAVDYDDKDAGTREELGYAYYMQDENDNALTQLEKAVALDGKSKLGYYYMGLTYLAMDKKEYAMDVYDKLKAIDADEAEKLLAKINNH